MNRTPVKSSHIASIGHDGTTLEVEYASGVVYRYSNVPEESFNSILTGESVGRGLRQAIHRDGVVGVKVEPEVVEVY
jgi:hypothetical protein